MTQVVFSQRALVQASLLVEHQPDTYFTKRAISRRGINERPTPQGRRVSAEASSESPSHGSQGKDAGRYGGPGDPAPCPLCNDRGSRLGPNGEAWRCHCRALPRHIPNTRRVM